jgi:hypothetical protein
MLRFTIPERNGRSKAKWRKILIERLQTWKNKQPE